MVRDVVQWSQWRAHRDGVPNAPELPDACCHLANMIAVTDKAAVCCASARCHVTRDKKHDFSSLSGLHMLSSGAESINGLVRCPHTVGRHYRQQQLQQHVIRGCCCSCTSSAPAEVAYTPYALLASAGSSAA